MFTISGCCHTHSNDLCVLHLYMLPQSWANNQLSRDLNNAFAILSWCESACTAWFNKKKLIFQLPFSFFPCVPAGTLSVCLTEKFAEPLLHTVALQFLCTIFTEETKSRSEEATSPDSKFAAALSDIVNGPSAGQLCELLLQVRIGGMWNLLVCSWQSCSNSNGIDGVCNYMQWSLCPPVDARLWIRGPFKTL